MKRRKLTDSILRRIGMTTLMLMGTFSLLYGQQAPQESPKPASAEVKVASQVVGPGAAAPNEHPLMPVIRWAEKERPNIEKIKDYTAIMTKQENLDGVVMEAQVMEIKVRHNPLSFYTKLRYPKKLNGQEAIYIPGQNDDKVICHGVGGERVFGTQRLPVDGWILKRGQKYTMDQMGILNLVDKLLEVAHKDVKYGECDVNYIENVKVDKRDCILIQVVHPVPRKNFIFHIARIYVDKEWNLPIRYESFDWPKKEGETPVLIEVYHYQQLKLNVGLTDADFDPTNPDYNYP